jgi:hypothetical protein
MNTICKRGVTEKDKQIYRERFSMSYYRERNFPSEAIDDSCYRASTPYSHLVFDMLGPVGPMCKAPLVKYGKGDSEKRLCGDALLQDKCLVISLGSNNELGFEEEIFARTHCTVHIFDCFHPGVVPITCKITFHLHWRQRR